MTQKWVFKKFVEAFYANNNDYNLSYCSLCSNPIYVNKENIQPKSNDQTQKQKDDFFNKIENLNMVHNKILGPSDKFPNAYWNLNDKFQICHLCTFILIHHHLAFTKLSDGSEIFINAPSFKIMYEMNRLVKEIFGKEETQGIQKREILAMSVIEYSRRLNASLGMWNQMNLEIIVKSREGIDTFSLPYQTVNLISDRKIASLLSQIGEFSILNTVLNNEEHKLIDIGHKLIRIGLKSYQEWNKTDKNVLNSFLHRESNKNNIIATAQKILELYANINERRKKYA
jgi:CRISPR-associated protein Cst1